MMQGSKFLERFKRLAEQGKGRLHGDLLLIEIIDDFSQTQEAERKTEGGIIMAESDHARSDYLMLKAAVGIVLEVGRGYYDPDTGKDVPLDRKPGEVVWVSDRGLSYCTTVPGIDAALPTKVVALTVDSEVKKSWDSLEEYNADRELLNV